MTSYGYDAVSRQASLAHDLSGATYDATTTITYNPAGQIASRVASNDSYAWSGALNLNRSYTTNGLNQYTAAGAGTTFGYDQRGNLSSVTTDTTAGSGMMSPMALITENYVYDSENRLASVPTSSITLASDPLGRLYQLAQSSTTQRFAYDGGQMIAEYNASNVLQARHVFGPGADEILVSYDAAGNRSWLIADERGSIVARTNASGAATAIANYDEYGISAGANVGRFGYTGQAWLPELGMNYYKVRIYSPSLGRFLQTDPVVTPKA